MSIEWDQNLQSVDDASDSPSALWPGDEGTISLNSRRALLELIKGPYLSGDKSSQLWSALLADERAIRARLNELFLDLIIDRVGEFAFVRNVDAGDLTVPNTVRSESLTFIDTAMLLVLRQTLLADEQGGRVIVGRDDVFDQLQVYRTADRDETDFGKRVNSSWGKMMNKLRVIHAVGDDRAEISPVLRLIVDADQVRQIGDVYSTIAAGSAPSLVSAEGSPDDVA